MKKNKQFGISTASAQITATVSVTLVLLLIGIIALLSVAAYHITKDIKENIGFDIVLCEDVSEKETNSLKQQLTTAHYVASIRYFSQDDALTKWQEDTGEDLIELLGVNPFCGEFEVKVRADYANSDSIAKIITPFKHLKYISDITVHDEMVDSINSNIKYITIVLVIISATLLLISFVLISNTVRLTVYSRRFTIHTMKLVGATGSFIRKPFIISNMINGLIAATLATILLVSGLLYLRSIDTSIANVIPWGVMPWIFVALLTFGLAICSIATIVATNKYLRISYDDMFK
ncbi:MAG: permease-like cell division protein FtsX [Muribaculaceae bacterium]|nr:permease-like cell division protein FtsX [Muribaculaceae bacterium]